MFFSGLFFFPEAYFPSIIFPQVESPKKQCPQTSANVMLLLLRPLSLRKTCDNISNANSAHVFRKAQEKRPRFEPAFSTF